MINMSGRNASAIATEKNDKLSLKINNFGLQLSLIDPGKPYLHTRFNILNSLNTLSIISKRIRHLSISKNETIVLSIQPVPNIQMLVPSTRVILPVPSPGTPALLDMGTTLPTSISTSKTFTTLLKIVSLTQIRVIREVNRAIFKQDLMINAQRNVNFTSLGQRHFKVRGIMGIMMHMRMKLNITKMKPRITMTDIMLQTTTTIKINTLKSLIQKSQQI